MDVVKLIPTPTTEKKKKKSAFQKYTETIGQTAEELARRDRRMQRFAEISERGTPPRVDTPDFVRDAQIAASLVLLPSHPLLFFPSLLFPSRVPGPLTGNSLISVLFPA